MFGKRPEDANWSKAAANSLFSFNGRERNHLFLARDGGFVDVGALSGADEITDARSFVAFDADDDGDLDVVVKNLQGRTLHFLRNDVETDAHRVAFRLQGRHGNRDAIGARITLTAGGKRRVKEVRSGSGFLSQSPTEVFFGLGPATEITRLEIRWGPGRTQVIEGLAADRRYRILEGATPEVLRTFPPGTTGGGGAAPDPWPSENDRPVRAEAPRQAPPLPTTPLNDAARGRPAGFTRPTLVCFVTSWCHSCREDVALLRKLWDGPRRGFDVVVVQVRDARVPERPGFDPATLPMPVFQGARTDLVAFRDALDFVVPSSFWIGVDGVIRRSYTGRLDGAALIADLRRLLGG